MAAERLSSMTNEELRNYLFFNSDQKSFIQATSEYIVNLTETEATAVKDASESLRSETNVQNGLVISTKEINDEVTQEIKKEEAEEHKAKRRAKRLGILSDVAGGLMVLASVITLNPALIALSTTAFTLQVSGGMNKMTNAVSHDPNVRAGFEFGFAAGEALACGGAGLAGDAQVASQQMAKGGAEAAEVAAQRASITTAQQIGTALNYSKNYLGQSLMLDNFWQDFFQGPCKMSSEDAMILGMVVGVGVGMLSMMASGASEDGLTQMARNKFNSLSDQGQQLFRKFLLTVNLMGDGAQVGTGVESTEVSTEYKALATFIHDAMAVSMKNFTLTQSLTSETNGMISQTENMLQAVTDDGAVEAQTFSSYGEMFRAAQ